ncbi:MAG TPA: SGNH/GDSL hydrolase family protein [Terriglobia bacterium]|nr:SGNH/GDSL hydrolase family protein [Terriglobia bacterium]
MSVTNGGITGRGLAHGGIPSGQLNKFVLNRQPLSRWKTDRDAAWIARTGRTKVVLYGDSSQASYGSDGVANFQAVKAMDARLARRFTAEGKPSTYQAAFGGHGVTVLSNWDFRISQGVFAYGSVGSYGISLGGEFFLAGSAATFSFTPKDDSQVAVSTDTADFYYCQDPSAGGVTKQIDTGTATAVNENGTSQMMKTTISGTLAGHTYKWNWASGSTNLVGVHCYNSAVKGVDFLNCGVVGAWAQQYVDANFKWNPSQALSILQPSLVFFSAGANDWLGGTALATVKASMKAAVLLIKATGADVVIVGYNPVGLDYNAVTTADGQMNLRRIQLEVAQETGCTFIDTLMLMGGPGAYLANLAAGLMQTDKLHRTFNGMTPIVNLKHDLMAA